MTVDDLRAIFLPYGALYDVSVPLTDDHDSARGRGFAFVWFVSKSDAAKAMDAINGIQLRHGAAEQAFLKKAKGKKGREAAKEELKNVQATAQPARPVAVDWSLSQKDWLARGEATEEQVDEVEDEPLEKDTPASLKRTRDERDNNEGVNTDEEQELDEIIENEVPDSNAPQVPRLASTDVGTTLFIRNLPYHATEDELKALFRSFGPLRYARITVDPETKRSRGTGFVCFWQRETADAVLHDAEIVQNETAATKPKTNPFSTPSVLTADPSAPLVARFTLHGRVLHVVRAVPREMATHLETTARKSREKNDKRHTYLLREGVPFPATPLAAVLSEKEIEKRMSSFSIRRAQLGANPSLHVSKTRLSVHQLPLFVTDKLLKKMALHAVRSFNDEVKQGTRPDLDEEEKADKTLSANAKSAKDGKVKPPPSIVVQSKVVLQTDRIDPLTGRGRSRGYGFLELRSFAHALKVLRWANGNKNLGRLLFGWWCEDLGAQRSKLAEVDTDEARLRMKRIDDALHELESRKSESRGVLRIEFSIENITTVRKRVLRQVQARENAKRRRIEPTPPSSKSEVGVAPLQTEQPRKSSIGSLIGRKRAQRKKKHAL